jgi:septal ring factor EnvC (AmiA/AmiB activator)
MSKKASQIPKLPVATDDEAKQDPEMHTQDQRLSVIEKSIDEIKTSNAQVQNSLNSFAEILAKFDA